ncbi:hypothetical protein EXIGLDRAFT_723868 [Exidia glandulosa HHB12029]|uniref:Uncharacterized protein n=1 Tax=Exidia glandulosa HHB12029 TaxID=1314781 RepID=A0A165MUZ1_EXIGL|nr:hypothetical protein EXIGLDRAFT_723868 [Exidia glandulosa HHB12029]
MYKSWRRRFSYPYTLPGSNLHYAIPRRIQAGFNGNHLPPPGNTSPRFLRAAFDLHPSASAASAVRGIRRI